MWRLAQAVRRALISQQRKARLPRVSKQIAIIRTTVGSVDAVPRRVARARGRRSRTSILAMVALRRLISSGDESVP